MYFYVFIERNRIQRTIKNVKNHTDKPNARHVYSHCVSRTESSRIDTFFFYRQRLPVRSVIRLRVFETVGPRAEIKIRVRVPPDGRTGRAGEQISGRDSPEEAGVPIHGGAREEEK